MNTFQILKLGILSLAVMSALIFDKAVRADFTDRYNRAMKKCTQISDKIADRDRSAESSSSTTTCGPVGTTLAPSWVISAALDGIGVLLNKNSIIKGASQYAADQEAGLPVDDTGTAILNAAHEWIQHEYGLEDPRVINQLIIDSTREQ